MPTSASGEGTLRWIPTEEAIEAEAEGPHPQAKAAPQQQLSGGPDIDS